MAAKKAKTKGKAKPMTKAKPKTPQIHKQKPLEEKLAACRLFVDLGDHLSEAARRADVPISTLAGWLEAPLIRSEVDKYRKEHARALSQDHKKAARDAAAGITEGILLMRQWMRSADPSSYRDRSPRR